jgi:effector-binding domain-containing protein
VFKIGEFSKLSQVTVKTLRYYDNISLLKPAEVDRFTSYRYYSVDQLPRLNRILALKDLGLSLEQIARLLEEDLSADQLRGMLRLKQAEIQQRVGEEQARLARVAARLRQIEQEGKMPEQEIVIKKVEPLKVAALRDIIPTYDAQGPLWDELVAFLMQHGVESVGPCLTIYHDTEHRDRDVDVEVCEPVGASLPDHPRIEVRELPTVETMASVIHEGSYDNFNETYTALLTWIEANGYRIVGPNREIYLRGPEHGGDPETYVTEVQFPVEKA